MTVLARDETALAIYQANRNDRAICEALLDEYLAPAEYTATLDAVRTAIREPGVCASCVITNSTIGPQWQSWFSEAF